jgi:hypothetical protein
VPLSRSAFISIRQLEPCWRADALRRAAVDVSAEGFHALDHLSVRLLPVWVVLPGVLRKMVLTV